MASWVRYTPLNIPEVVVLEYPIYRFKPLTVLQNNLPDLSQQIKSSTIMTVGKAIKALDMLIKNKQESKTGMLAPEKPWNHKEDCVTSLARTIAGNLQNDVEWLQAIKRQLLPEQHRTKIVCRHPKKMQDVCDGQRYCMNCNANL